MGRHLKYFQYLARHKWFVFVACRRCGVSIWQAVIHDWHKCLPSEWGPYTKTFYNRDGSKRYQEFPGFAGAWNFHQKRGKHHWQYWLLTWDRGDTEPLPMPEKYWREMVADWWGAGRAITGSWGAPAWYVKNRKQIQLSDDTRRKVELLLELTAPEFGVAGNMELWKDAYDSVPTL